jgi:hypothetical protein
MSGSKTIQNKSSVALNVVLRGRIGDDPSNGSLPPVSGTIPPNESRNFQYGNDKNPYLNSLEVDETANGSDVRQIYAATKRGGTGTIDNLFNVNSTLVVAYNATNYGYALTGHN